MQAGPRRTRLVRAATPASSTIDSILGLPSRLSPTQTDVKVSDRSAISAICIICSGVVTPKRTPRLGSVSPIFMALGLQPALLALPTRVPPYAGNAAAAQASAGAN